MASRRISMFDNLGNSLGDLRRDLLRSAPTMVEELGGEFSLSFETAQHVDQYTYLLWQDEMGKWHEWCVTETPETHDGTECYAIQSMQHDLSSVSGGVLWASAEEGTHDPIAASQALRIALSSQRRWQAGDVTVPTMRGASLYNGQVWDYLGKLVDTWGGEMVARVEVGPTGVVSRYVDWLAHVGSETVTRRFEYTRDLTGIRRIPDPGPYYCGIEPRSSGTGTDDDGVDYSSGCGIEEEPESEGHEAGSPYLFDPTLKEAFRRPDGEGGWEYPTKAVVYDIETPGDQEELLSVARADLPSLTPNVTYEADVLQLAAAGMDWRGVAIGDEAQCVDRGFNPDVGLRVQGRVLRMERELPILGDTGEVRLTIGNLGTSLNDAINSLISTAVGTVSEDVERIKGGGTLVYLQSLLDAINAELNVSGGYVYYSPGKGQMTYDAAVSDPTVGAEASQVTQIVGGGMRIANSRTSAGDWDWRSVFTSGHVAADMVTAANLVAGYIGNPDGSVYIDLDNGTLKIGPSALVGDGTTTMQEVMQDISDARRMATDFLSYADGIMTLGRIDSAIKLLLTNSRLHFDTAAGEVASFGMNADTGIWEMNVDTANVENYLRFNNFTWIARENGNMSIKRFT